MSFIDGFVAPVRAGKRKEYRVYAQRMGAVFKEFGALQVVDGWGADVPDGKLTSFPMAVKLEPGEVVAFGWIRWPSREVRDSAWNEVMKDPRMQGVEMPFDGKRMIFGAFELIAES